MTRRQSSHLVSLSDRTSSIPVQLTSTSRPPKKDSNGAKRSFRSSVTRTIPNIPRGHGPPW